MATFEMIKMSADVLLFCSLCFLSYRILANGSLSGKTAQLMILEASLKGLIKDADGAGRSLNEELQRRQYSLERLLADLEKVEKKATQVQNSFEDNKIQIDAHISQARELLHQISQSLGAAKTLGARRQVIPPVEVKSAPIVDETPEPPSFETMVVKKDERHKLPTRNRSPRLSSKIEREVETPNPIMPEAVERTMDEVRGAASDVRKISQEIEVRSEEKTDTQEQQPAAADSRLGVLGSMRRQVQTL